MKFMSKITLLIFLISLGFPSMSIASSEGPKVSQRSSTGTEDASDSGIVIDIYYQVIAESGVDESKVPETYIRLPGKELDTSLRARPTLISGSIFNGSWLARFAYSKGIPPGIYVASTSTWFDTKSNPSSIPSAVTIRVDNLAVTSTEGVNIKPTNLRCGPIQRVEADVENSENLSASLFCSFTANSLRNGYKINAFIDQVPLNTPSPLFTHINDQIIYPRVLTQQKIGKTFTLANVSSGDYILRVVLEFLEFPDLTQTFIIKLSKNSTTKSQAEASESNTTDKTEENSKQYYIDIAKKEIAGWLEKINANSTELQKNICFDLPKFDVIFSTFTDDFKNNEQVLKNFQTFIYGKLFTDTVERIKTCSDSISKPVLASSPPAPKNSSLLNPKGKKVTITCKKNTLTKKVSGTNPKCPRGYKKA